MMKASQETTRFCYFNHNKTFRARAQVLGFRVSGVGLETYVDPATNLVMNYLHSPVRSWNAAGQQANSNLKMLVVKEQGTQAEILGAQNLLDTWM